DIPVNDSDRPIVPFELFLKPLTNRDRTVSPAGTTDRRRKITAILRAVAGQQENQQIVKAIHHLFKIGLASEEFLDRRVLPSLLAQAGNEVRVGEETDVEEEIGPRRDAVFEPEADQRDHHRRLFAGAPQTPGDPV